ncbi:family 20 glycosylhydrolase [uncultured Thiodictyon sp.]|uniref:beta-N-acetylhexosaminidase n=1 Tax=uncultured Thiodictyon sp. TaxID=1846217 RepID=UPI0025EF4CD5|nr:family 20 glycosylhydrolase [uncultured Thiodictyon sp.]
MSLPPLPEYDVKPSDELILLPAPRAQTLGAAEFQLADGMCIALRADCAQDLLPIGQRLRDALHQYAQTRLQLTANALQGTGITLVISGPPDSDEAYCIDIRPAGVMVQAGTPHGVFHGVSTLMQIAQQRGGCWPALRIDDEPDFAQRGVMLDISRDKVPTMETLRTLIDLLASWKINQLQLYTEHTFAYRDHRTVWEHASPMTAEEVLELDAYCRARFIELVPNQNSFGHLERWLKHPQYNDLAETPAGGETRWGVRPPSGLNPRDPRSLELLRGLYDELLPNFSSRQFNVGCDETVDLGQGRNQALAAQLGTGELYLAFLQQIHREVSARGHTMQFWGDIILEHPSLVPRLPQDLIALEWGYEHDHPFASHALAFAESGIPFYVCPGTSTWNAILGRTDNMLGNIANACDNGLKNGAGGVLNTDWGDNGHWQYLPFSYAGFAYGAAMSWGVEANRGLALARALDTFAFEDAAGVMGELMLALGRVGHSLDGWLNQRTYNATPFGRALLMGREEIRQVYGAGEGVRGAAAQAAQSIGALVQRLPAARMGRGDAPLIAREVALAARLAQHGCARIALAAADHPSRSAEMQTDLRAILRAHRPLWLARNRPGGFSDSAARLRGLLKDY